MQLHFSADTTTTFILNVLRECNVVHSPVTSNYVFQFEQAGTNVVKSTVLADQSSTPANFQSFTIDAGAVGLGVGDHTYRVYFSGDTETLLSGWATVHGTPPISTEYTAGDDTPVITYD